MGKSQESSEMAIDLSLKLDTQDQEEEDNTNNIDDNIIAINMKEKESSKEDHQDVASLHKSKLHDNFKPQEVHNTKSLDYDINCITA